MSDLRVLLDRCHRAELVPLAQGLGIDPAGRGLAGLTGEIDAGIRRAGGQAFANLLRGQGPTYTAIIRDLAKALGLSRKGQVREIEARILDEWVARSWDAMAPEDRTLALARSGLNADPWVQGRVLVGRARQVLGTRANFRFAAAAAIGLGGATVLSPVAWPVVPIFAWHTVRTLLAPELAITLPAVVHIASLREILRHRLTIGFVGSPSAGKDAAISALFGLDTGRVHPLAGSTREVQTSRIPGSTALFVVNTPGMGDVVEAVTEEARQVLRHIDIYVYVLNTEGGVKARELADYRACITTGKPVLVALNKTDTLRPKDRERYIADAREKLGGDTVTLLPCAFDPLPVLSEVPIGVEAVRQWLVAQVEAQGKDPGEIPPLGGWPDSHWEPPESVGLSDAEQPWRRGLAAGARTLGRSVATQVGVSDRLEVVRDEIATIPERAERVGSGATHLLKFVVRALATVVATWVLVGMGAVALGVAALGWWILQPDEVADEVVVEEPRR